MNHWWWKIWGRSDISSCAEVQLLNRLDRCATLLSTFRLTIFGSAGKMEHHGTFFFCTRMCSPQTCRRSPGADGILQIHCLQHGAIVPSLILENERQLTMEYCERWFSQPACVCVLHFLFENPLTFLYSVVMMDHPVLNSTRVVSCAVHSLSGLHIQIVKH